MQNIKQTQKLSQNELKEGPEIFWILGKNVAAATIGDYLVNPKFLT